MALLKNLWSVLRSKPALSNKMHIWDSRMLVIDLTGCGDVLTLGELCGSGGISAMGASGSGKTSVMAPYFAYPLMKLGCGFVWCCAKSSEAGLAARIAEAAGRADDVVYIGEGLDGKITSERFNPLEYEASILTNGTGALVQYLSALAQVQSRKVGEHAPAEGERFWQDMFERLLRHCIDTAKLAGRPLSVDLLRKIQQSAPKNKDELTDPDFQKRSECFRCLRDADIELSIGHIAEEDFNRIIAFWMTDYVGFDVKPRSTVDAMFGACTDAFLSEEPLRSLLTTTTTITPEMVIDKGLIVILNLPVNLYGGAGRMAQFAFRKSMERAVLRRKIPHDDFARPVVIWSDEHHSVCHPTDSAFAAECRDSRCINVYIEQGCGGYLQALGFSNADQVDGYLSNHSLRLYFQNQSPLTNRYAAESAGRMLVDKPTSSFGGSLHGSHFGRSVSPEERNQVLTGMFTLLKRGGPSNGGLVEAIAVRPGVFLSTGNNYALCTFKQTDLTR